MVVALAAPSVLARSGREVEIRISRAGFDPVEVTLRAGETVRLLLSTEDGEHCFAVDELRVEKRVASGRPTSVELTVDRPGRLVFYCCVETGEAARLERGALVITE